MTDPIADERKRDTSRLQRQAQSYATAELRVEHGSANVDRQVAMLVQHAQEVTGARRATLFRPVSRSQWWHTVSVLGDGGFYDGLVASDSLVLPMVAYHDRRPVALGPARPYTIPAPRVDKLGFRSYLGLPLVAGNRVLAVLEAVDIAQADRLEGYAASLHAAMEALTTALTVGDGQPGGAVPAERREGLTEAAVLDLVLRPPVNEDATFEVLGEEWALLAHIDGTRVLGEVAAAAGLARLQEGADADVLLERRLIRIGRQDRRR